MSIAFDVVIEPDVIDVVVTPSVSGGVLVGGTAVDVVVSPVTVDTILVGGPVINVLNQTLTGCDGIKTSFNLTKPPVNNASVQVFRNGLAEVPGVGFTVEYSGNATAVTFTSAPLADDVVVVSYHV